MPSSYTDLLLSYTPPLLLLLLLPLHVLCRDSVDLLLFMEKISGTNS